MTIDAPSVAAIAEAHRDVPGGLLPALHALQDRFGHVPDAAVPVLAQAFNRSRAEVHGVLTYYHHFRREPVAGRVVQLCRAEACQAMGAGALAEHAKACLAGRDVTLEAVYCLGLCASSPAMLVDGKPHARLTPARFDAILAEGAAR